MKFSLTPFRIALPCALLLCSLAAGAQQGRLSGVIRDPHQAAVAGASVTARNLVTQKGYVANSDSQGEYTFKNLEAGNYRITAAAAGFKQTQGVEVQVKESGEAVKNIPLALAGNVSTITVNELALDVNPLTQPQASLINLPEGLQGESVTFTAKDIEDLHPSSLLDVLQQVPGMEITYQGRQHLDFSSMRGGNYQVILDGVYLAQTTRFLALVPSQIVDTMTIVRDSTALSIGPLAAYHVIAAGNSASSSGVSNQGFIIIKTKRSAKAEAGLLASGGNWATALGHGYAGAKSGNWDYRAAYTYATSAGRNGWNMGYRNGSLTFHGGYTSNNLIVDFLYYGSRGSRRMEYGLQYFSTPTNVSNGQCAATGVNVLCVSSMNIYKMNTDLFAVNAVKLWNNANRTTLQYGFDRMVVNAGNWPLTPAGNTNEQDSTEANLVLKHTLLVKKNSLTAGGQFMKYVAPLGQAPNIGLTKDAAGVYFLGGYRQDDSMASWFLQDEYRLFSNRLTLDAGLRGDLLHNSWSSAKAIADKVNHNGKVDDWRPTFLTLAAGAYYKFTPKLNSSLRYSRLSFNAPTNFYYKDASGALTTNLPIQTQSRGEGNVNYAYNPHLKANFSLYAYKTYNTTAAATNCGGVFGASSTYIDANGNELDCVAITDILTGGLEAGFSGLLLGPLTYNAGYGYLATDNTSTNKTLSHNFVNASLNYKQKSYFGNFSMVYVGPKSTSVSAMGTVTGVQISNYTRYDANLGYNFKPFHTQQYKLTLFGRNLSDNNYSTRYVTGAYRDPGLAYGVELAAKLF